MVGANLHQREPNVRSTIRESFSPTTFCTMSRRPKRSHSGTKVLRTLGPSSVWLASLATKNFLIAPSKASLFARKPRLHRDDEPPQSMAPRLW